MAVRGLFVAPAALAAGLGVGALVWLAAGDTYSNVLPADYVGPAACRECHEDTHRDNYASWSEHAHRFMNQDASEASVLGDFSGAPLEYGGGTATFEREGPTYWMKINRDGEPLRRHRVTRTVGSLYVQYYIGTQVDGPEPAGDPTYRTEAKLPFGYSVALARWLPEIYFDSTVASEPAYLGGREPDYIYAEPPRHTWNVSCLTCHNTYPYVARLWKQTGRLRDRTPWRGGFPEGSIEWRGPADHGGRVALGGGLRGLHRDELVTVGISCESCHFGGREHAENEREIRFVPTSPDLAIHRPGSDRPVVSDRDDPFVVNAICAQCHNAQLNVYPDGTPAVNSNESNALAAGACASAIKCTDCHDPHRAGPASGAPDPIASVEACLGCHPQFDAPAARAEHAQHPQGGPDAVSCLDCHMPRIVAGLDTIVRSHRIAQPIDVRMLRRRNLNACNLCHLDRSIRWTLDALRDGWGIEPADGAELAEWYGRDVDTAAGALWQRSGNRFVRMATTEAYARASALPDRLPPMLRSLDDDYAFNRTVGLIAVERVLGERIPPSRYDLLAPAETRAKQVADLTATLGATR